MAGSMASQAGEFWSLVHTWGNAGTNNGEFPGVIHGIAVDPDGDVYATDHGGGNSGVPFVRRIQKFGASGNCLDSLGSYGTNSGQFIGILGVASDLQANIYATDYLTGRIHKFPSDGGGIHTFVGSAQAFGVAGIAVDSNGYVYVSDRPASQLVKYSPAGNPITNWATAAEPNFVAVDRLDNIYVSAYGGIIQKFSAAGTLLGVTQTGASSFAPGVGVAVDQAGNVWAAHAGGYGYGDEGFVRQFSNQGASIPVSFDHPFNRPASVAVGPDGTLYVAEYEDSPHLHAFRRVDPVITKQPKSQVGYWGKEATFTVAAGGAATLDYQWLKDGTVLPSATSSVLTLTNLQMSDAGSYEVIVANAYGSVTSSPAILIMNPAGVSIALYAGVTIDGVPGQTYGIQSTSTLSDTNSWVGRANITLTTPTAVWYDPQPASFPQRYYRVVPGPITIP